MKKLFPIISFLLITRIVLSSDYQQNYPRKATLTSSVVASLKHRFCTQHSPFIASCKKRIVLFSKESLPKTFQALYKEKPQNALEWLHHLIQPQTLKSTSSKPKKE